MVYHGTLLHPQKKEIVITLVKCLIIIGLKDGGPLNANKTIDIKKYQGI